MGGMRGRRVRRHAEPLRHVFTGAMFRFHREGSEWYQESVPGEGVRIAPFCGQPIMPWKGRFLPLSEAPS